MKVSIVIPAYRPVALLSACISGILRNTDMTEVEVIVVCNGSDQESAENVLISGPPFKLFWTDDALGFTKAANIGFKLALGEIVIVLNTDAVILDYAPRNEWLNRLTNPFVDSNVGVTGLGFMWTNVGTYAPFYCAAIRRSLFDEFCCPFNTIYRMRT